MKEIVGAGVSPTTLELVHLRVSQINGCAWCLNYGVKTAKKLGETDERLALVAAWREARCFTDEERAALALAEAMTRLTDGPGVPDDVWDAAATHYDEKQLAALVFHIAMTNLFNRTNVAVRQPANTRAF